MSQGRLILNVNPNFERGNTDGFTEVLTGTTGSFVDRRDARINPKRQVFTPLLKSRSDYIFNGRFSRRYSLDAGGDFTLEMDAIPVEPGMKVSVDIVFRTDSPAEDPGAQLRINGVLLDATTISVIRNRGNPPLVPLNSPILHSPGNPFNYSWQAADATIDLTGDDTGPLELWYHHGFSIEIPQSCISLDPIFLYAGQAAAANVVDVGQFSIQALDSLNHAGG